ncbi:MAG TPA: lamin tail domain-containing protein [Candidatus Paceibacterota bacterium]
MIRFVGIIISLLYLPFVASAQVVITEIMYDVEGSDSEKEWVEIYNSDSESITIKGGTSGQDSWRIYHKSASGVESNKTFASEAYQGTMTLAPNGYAVVVQNGDSFKNDHPDYGGNILVASAMSLTNSSMTVGLRLGSSGIPWSIVEYVSDLGANGDGKSLQKINGTWSPALPNPGSSVSDESSGGESVATSEPAQSISASVAYTSVPEKTITTKIQKREALAVVGAATEFSGLVFGVEGEPITSGARFIWNFGDGVTAEGEKVLHSFSYPGEYVVVLEGSSGKYASSDKVLIRAVDVPVSLSREENAMGSFIKIANGSSYEINISGWIIKGLYKHFVIPKNTFIASQKNTNFSREVLGFDITSYESAVLLYPNGTVVVQGVEQDSSVATPSGIKKETVVAGEEKVASSPPKTEEGIQNAEYEGEKHLVASAASSDVSESMYPWLMGLLGLIGISLASVFMVRHSKQEGENRELSAGDFKIIEEK